MLFQKHWHFYDNSIIKDGRRIKLKIFSVTMKYILPLCLLMTFRSSNLVGQSDSVCYLNVNSSKELNQVLLSNISTSLISQYILQVSQIPSGGLIGSNHCIYEVSVTKDGEKTFVTLQGKDLNSFWDSYISGIDGFQQAILRSLYRSQRYKNRIYLIFKKSELWKKIY